MVFTANTGGGQKGKKDSQGQISTNRKNRAVELKGIPEDIIGECKITDICHKCGKGPKKWFEYYPNNPIATRMVPRKGGIPQVRDI